MRTVSLDLAIKLRENGFPQKEIYFNWVFRNKEDGWEIDTSVINHDKPFEDTFEWCASPTADELLDRLPCATQQEWFLISKNPSEEEWVIDWNTKNEIFKGNSLADACALMYIYLKEQSLISQKEKIE